MYDVLSHAIGDVPHRILPFQIRRSGFLFFPSLFLAEVDDRLEPRHQRGAPVDRCRVPTSELTCPSNQARPQLADASTNVPRDS